MPESMLYRVVKIVMAVYSRSSNLHYPSPALGSVPTLSAIAVPTRALTLWKTRKPLPLSHLGKSP